MPTPPADTVSLELSFDELRWLAGAFGAMRLPLMLGQTNSEPPLVTTQTRLLQRGLIQRGPLAGWQVEPFTAVIMQWMLGAQHFWRFQKFLRDGGYSEFTLFKQDNAALLVLPLPDGKRFIACSNVDAAISEWQAALNLHPASEVGNLLEWDVPQPVTVIRSSWKNPERAKDMAPPLFLDWARQLDWAGEWLLVQNQNSFSRFAMAAQGAYAWAGRWTPGNPGEFVLKAWQPGTVKQIFLEGV